MFLLIEKSTENLKRVTKKQSEYLKNVGIGSSLFQILKKRQNTDKLLFMAAFLIFCMVAIWIIGKSFLNSFTKKHKRNFVE